MFLLLSNRGVTLKFSKLNRMVDLKQQCVRHTIHISISFIQRRVCLLASSLPNSRNSFRKLHVKMHCTYSVILALVLQLCGERVLVKTHTLLSKVHFKYHPPSKNTGFELRRWTAWAKNKKYCCGCNNTNAYKQTHIQTKVYSVYEWNLW